jgi:hypothetical protein
MNTQKKSGSFRTKGETIIVRVFKTLSEFATTYQTFESPITLFFALIEFSDHENNDGIKPKKILPFSKTFSPLTLSNTSNDVRQRKNFIY